MMHMELIRLDNIPLFLWYCVYCTRDDVQRFSRRISKRWYITRRVICPFYFGTSIEAGKSINIVVTCLEKLAEQ